MGNRLRKTLVVVGAAAGLFATQALPAQAALAFPQRWYDANLRVVKDGGPCFRPDFNGYGATIHAAPCDAASEHWNYYLQTQQDSRNTGWYIITWSVGTFTACLVPNWDRVGSPLVLADNCDAVSGGHSYEWYFWPESNGKFELVNNGNTSLVMDMDISAGNYGRLQEWTANYWDNQKFFVTGGHS